MPAAEAETGTCDGHPWKDPTAHLMVFNPPQQIVMQVVVYGIAYDP